METKLKASKKQMQYIAEILGDTYNHTVLNFEKETDDGYEYYDDRIYIDGDITFCKMAEIVDYIRKQNNKSMDVIKTKCMKSIREKAEEYVKMEHTNKT